MRKVELLPTRDCEAGYSPAAVTMVWFIHVVYQVISGKSSHGTLINDKEELPLVYFCVWVGKPWYELEQGSSIILAHMPQ